MTTLGYATTTTSGWNALEGADPRLQAFAGELVLLDPAGDADGWAIGNVLRDQADQDSQEAAGRSDLVYPESGHNRTPAQAIDVWPIRYTDAHPQGAVIGDPNHPAYGQIGVLAHHHGLVWGGDWARRDPGHVEITGWRDELSDAIAEGPENGTAVRAGVGGALVLLLVLLFLGASR